MTKQLRAASRLFDGAAAGHYDLPSELTALTAAHKYLTAAELPPRVSEGEEHQRLIAATIEASKAGLSLPGADDLLAARIAGTAEAALVNARTVARDRLVDEIVTTTLDMADTIVTDHLRPVFDAALDALRRCIEVTTPYGNSAGEMLTAPPKVRQAWLDVEAQLARYVAVQSGRLSLALLGYKAQVDIEDDFAVLRDMHQVWPRVHRQMAGGPPWPSDTRAKVTWWLRNGVELWLPTVAEQDQRFSEVYADDMQRMKVSAANANAAHAWGNG